MKLKIASYNISSGLYKEDNSVDFLDKKKESVIDLNLLNETIRIINEEDIDVICFQEIITTKSFNYINRITEKTNLKYYDSFELSKSHIVENAEMGIAILSKYPIISSIKNFFTNPKLSKTTESGITHYIFDKGLLISKINIDNKIINILTHHGFPFRKFNSTPEENINTFVEFDNYIKEFNPDIITGDFNSESFLEMMKYTKENYIKTISEPTTLKGKKYDNILIKKENTFSSKIVKSLSDHYMIISNLKL